MYSVGYRTVFASGANQFLPPWDNHILLTRTILLDRTTPSCIARSEGFELNLLLAGAWNERSEGKNNPQRFR
jgi:hypothetical protein